jgi:ribosome-binding factor A
MTIRQERLADVIQKYASEDIITYSQMHDHDFGVISVLSVTVSPDYTYADISVMSQNHRESLPKFLTAVEPTTRRRITKDFSLWKIPKLRFRIDKKEGKTTDILTLIHTLDTQYGLSREDNR